uniref:Uncharacterized protein n=1 Tax=Heterorhabditis bacteriophora TaxID=37862 RepID=A0A1I7X726_HETBA
MRSGDIDDVAKNVNNSLITYLRISFYASPSSHLKTTNELDHTCR